MSLNLDKSAWKRVVLRDVVRHITDRVDAETSGIERFLAGEHIPSGRLTITDWGVIGRDPIGPMFYKRFQPGHVLYVSRRTYLRKAAVPDFEGITGEKTFVLETLDPGVLLQEFLPFVLSAEHFHTYAVDNSRGSVNPYLNWGELASYEFSIPPVEDQRRIVDLLMALERVLDARLALGNATRSILDRWMVESVDSGCSTRQSIGSLLEHQIGGVWGVEAGTSELEVRVIRGTDISLGGAIAWQGAPSRSIAISESRSRLLQEGDVLIEKSGGSPEQPVGKVGFVDEQPEAAVPSNFVLLARPNREICRPEFLFVLLRGMWTSGAFAPFTGKTTNIANLRTKELLACEVAVPSLSEQATLATQLQFLEDAGHAAAAASAQVIGLKAVLLNEIFGGS